MSGASARVDARAERRARRQRWFVHVAVYLVGLVGGFAFAVLTR